MYYKLKYVVNVMTYNNKVVIYKKYKSFHKILNEWYGYNFKGMVAWYTNMFTVINRVWDLMRLKLL